MKTSKTLILTYSALAIALNVILGTVVSSLKIPLLFLDTIGTVLIAVLFGPWWGALAGESAFASTFISRITGNFVDKMITCLLVAFMITRLPNLSKIMNKEKRNAA